MKRLLLGVVFTFTTVLLFSQNEKECMFLVPVEYTSLVRPLSYIVGIATSPSGEETFYFIPGFTKTNEASAFVRQIKASGNASNTTFITKTGFLANRLSFMVERTCSDKDLPDKFDGFGLFAYASPNKTPNNSYIILGNFIEADTNFSRRMLEKFGIDLK